MPGLHRYSSMTSKFIQPVNIGCGVSTTLPYV